MNGRLTHCRWCQNPITCPRRRTFCSAACVHEHRIRSNPTYVRQCLKKRDHGICCVCRVNCSKLEQERSRRVRELQKLGYCSYLECSDKLKVIQAAAAQLQEFFNSRAIQGWPLDGVTVGLAGKPRIRTHTYWNADHILPVQHGGGLCGLENYQTMCVRCHREKTKLQRAQAKLIQAQQI